MHKKSYVVVLGVISPKYVRIYNNRVYVHIIKQNPNIHNRLLGLMCLYCKVLYEKDISVVDV